MSNALKYTVEGQVKISVWLEDLPEDVSVVFHFHFHFHFLFFSFCFISQIN